MRRDRAETLKSQSTAHSKFKIFHSKMSNYDTIVKTIDKQVVTRKGKIRYYRNVKIDTGCC